MKLKEQIILLVLAGVLILGGFLYHDWQLHHKLVQHQAAWEEIHRQQAEQNHRFAHLLYHAGYGGFIHNFKNLILRQDPKYLAAAEQDRAALQQALQAYAALRLSPEEQQALTQVQATFEEYFAKLDLVKPQLLAARMDNRQLDQRVKVEDGPARAALQTLATATLEKSRQQQALTRDKLDQLKDNGTWVLLTLGLGLGFAALLIHLLLKLYRTQADLLDAHGHLSSLLDSVPDSMLIINDQGTITHANKKAVEFFGYPFDRLLGMQVEQLMPQAKRAHHVELRKDFMQHPRSRSMGQGLELTALNAQGVEIPVEISLGQIRHLHRNEVIATVHDISQRKQADEILRRSENRLKISQAIAQVGTWDWDIATNDLVWSDEIFNIFGLDQKTVHPNYPLFLSCIPPEDQPIVTSGVEMALKGEKSYDVIHRILHPAGQIKVLHEMGEVFRDASGKPERMVGVVHDVTLVKEAEQALIRAKEQAQAASQAKSDFLANMSHEIRTPLNAVLGFAEVLAEDIENPQHREYLTAIDRAGRSLLRLISDILDLSKIEANKLEILPAPSRTETLFQEIREIFEFPTLQKGLALRFEQSADFPPHLTWDEARVRQILVNLVGNAVKFTEAGEIVVAAKLLGQPTPGTVDLEFQVRDTGMGVPETQKEVIFGAFNQLPGQDHGKYGGTGLGLAISRRLVSMMGGRIQVADNHPRGSIFRFTLPGVPLGQAIPPASPALPDKVTFAPAEVLIIFDHAEDKQLLCNFLAGSGLHAQAVAMGPAALQQAYQTPFAAILLDLPLQQGQAMATEIHRQGVNRTTPLVLITATFNHGLHHPVDSEVALALTKPLAKSTLLQGLAKLWSSPGHPPAPSQDLLAWLKTLAPLVDSFHPGSTVNELDAFAKQVSAGARLYPWPPLQAWAQALNQAVQAFNLPLFREQLQDYVSLNEQARNQKKS